MTFVGTMTREIFYLLMVVFTVFVDCREVPVWPCDQREAVESPDECPGVSPASRSSVPWSGPSVSGEWLMELCLSFEEI